MSGTIDPTREHRAVIPVERVRCGGKAGLALTLRALVVEACVVLAGTLLFLLLAAAVGVPKVTLRVNNPSPDESRREAQVYERVEKLFSVSALTGYGPER